LEPSQKILQVVVRCTQRHDEMFGTALNDSQR
jgi:hypothetical protein